ncbi:hypothetical protein KC19_5G081700 [Ceratodon purpureus]|uniref:Uncharacterized protein n=1 Tax=Ceratodon purpureus TaxID=3225 RepID=A0A8T0I1I9_CERPU|nr:hypothetical protein KC19_5G081700 [Ceratodon purpureus]
MNCTKASVRWPTLQPCEETFDGREAEAATVVCVCSSTWSAMRVLYLPYWATLMKRRLSLYQTLMMLSFALTLGKTKEEEDRVMDMDMRMYDFQQTMTA